MVLLRLGGDKHRGPKHRDSFGGLDGRWGTFIAATLTEHKLARAPAPDSRTSRSAKDDDQQLRVSSAAGNNSPAPLDTSASRARPSNGAEQRLAGLQRRADGVIVRPKRVCLRGRRSKIECGQVTRPDKRHGVRDPLTYLSVCRRPWSVGFGGLESR